MTDKTSRASAGSRASREFECKLGGTPEALKKARAVAEKLCGTELQWREDKLENVYYDTSDMRLSRRRVALRVRRKKGQFIQTLKTEETGAGPFFDRGEWEQFVDGLSPRLDLLPEDAVTAMGLVLPGELTETFRTTFVRQSAKITRGGGLGPVSEVEIAIDRGEVKGGGGTEPIQECELELLSGDPRDLFELALALQQEAGLRVLQDSKAARGYALLTPADPMPVKAEKTPLSSGQTVSEALAEILRRGTSQMLANEKPSLIGTDPEGVHQMRVAIRRMRSTLSVFGPLLDAERVAWLKDELKWIGGSLGPARDWDVFSDEILGVVAKAGAGHEAGIKALAEDAEKKRIEGYKLVREAIGSSRYSALVLRLSAFTETAGWSPHPCPSDHPLSLKMSDVAPMLLDRAYKKSIKAGRNLAELDMPARHELRIRIKKLRYTVDFMHGFYDTQRKKRFLKFLSALQDDFGHLNDVATAEDLLAMLRAAPTGKSQQAVKRSQDMAAAAGSVMGWHMRGLLDGEERFLRNWDDFTACKPFWRGGS